MATAADEKPLTARDVNELLWRRYTDRGEYVVLFDVPDVVGVTSKRRCDAIALGMWGSTGRLIHGFEVKVSRSDWLRELKDVTKADPFIEQCDRWWLVTGNDGVAKLEEIPVAWGWMTATKHGLRVQRPAQPLPRHELLRRLWAFALIRRAADRGDPNSEEFRISMEQHRKSVEERCEAELQLQIARLSPAYEELKKRVEAFEKESGMSLQDWRLGNVGKLARAIAALNNGGYSGFSATLRDHLRELHALSKRTQEAIDACADPAGDLDPGAS